jgi:hypothetical protein
MKSTLTTAAYPVLSTTRITLISLISAAMTSAIVLLAQWLIYDDWLHRSGPLRIIGTLVSGTLTFIFVQRWQSIQRQRQLETVARFETIARMNDRIRNSLQAIAYVTYVDYPDAINPVRDAVERIDEVLKEVLVELRPELEVAHVPEPLPTDTRAASA